MTHDEDAEKGKPEEPAPQAARGSVLRPRVVPGVGLNQRRLGRTPTTGARGESAPSATTKDHHE